MSADVRVTLACGCVQLLGSNGAAPQCETHHEYRVARVSAPPPRITAVNCEATGPLVRKGT